MARVLVLDGTVSATVVQNTGNQPRMSKDTVQKRRGRWGLVLNTAGQGDGLEEVKWSVLLASQVASPWAGGQTQRRFTVQDAMAKRTDPEGKASVARAASSSPARTSPGACPRQRP